MTSVMGSLREHLPPEDDKHRDAGGEDDGGLAEGVESAVGCKHRRDGVLDARLLVGLREVVARHGFDTFGEATVVFAAGVAVLVVLRREVLT